MGVTMMAVLLLATFFLWTSNSLAVLNRPSSAYVQKFQRQIQKNEIERDDLNGVLGLEENRVSVGNQIRTLSVDIQCPIGNIDSYYLGVTIDSSLAKRPWKTLDFKSQKVQNLARGLGPTYLRFGGTNADCMTFDSNSNHAENLSDHDSYGYEPNVSNFTLSAKAWDDLCQFVQSVGWSLIMDLNYLNQRFQNGSWNPTNARLLLNYSMARSYPIGGFELGNEYDQYPLIFKQVVTSEQLVADTLKLKQLLQEFPMYSSSFIIGPEIAGNRVDYKGFIQAGGADVVQAGSVHQYYVNGNNPDLPAFTSIKVMNGLISYLSSIINDTKAVKDIPVWLSETSSAYNSGAPNISDRFVAGFLWLDKIGVCASLNISAVIRQTFYDLNYALIDMDLNPNPDYWLTLLYKYLIQGPAFIVHTDQPDIRAYSACASNVFKAGAIVVYALNPNNYSVELNLPMFADQPKVLYSLTAGDSDGLLSKFTKLNGNVLKMQGDELPELRPVTQPSGPVKMSEYSLIFVIMPEAKIPNCLPTKTN